MLFSKASDPNLWGSQSHHACHQSSAQAHSWIFSAVSGNLSPSLHPPAHLQKWQVWPHSQGPGSCFWVSEKSDSKVLDFLPPGFPEFSKAVKSWEDPLTLHGAPGGGCQIPNLDGDAAEAGCLLGPPAWELQGHT